MLTKFQNHLTSNFPQLKDKKLLLAVSGGIDSMVLWHLLHQLNYEISIAHCNFQLRGEESNEDEQFVKAQVEHLLTAHHLDDTVETFLINLIRGTGLDGLTGIPARNESILRPLLPFSRAEIEEYAKKNQIQWREDSSNASDKYFRNKFLDSFQNTLENLQQSATLVQDASELVYEKVVEKSESILIIDLKKLVQFANYQAYLYQWLNKYGFTAWQDIYDLVHSQSGKQVFSKTHFLLKDREKLLLSERKSTDNEEVFTIASIESKVNIPLNLEFCKAVNILDSQSNCIFVNENKLKFPLTIRKWQTGDYFYPSGMNGKKKLSKFFKDEKYSILDKQNQWLLCSENQIIWIIGKRADNRYIATETTQNTLKIELK
jgi:tRNA(Ile)-lysidine synthase